MIVFFWSVLIYYVKDTSQIQFSWASTPNTVINGLCYYTLEIQIYIAKEHSYIRTMHAITLDSHTLEMKLFLVPLFQVRGAIQWMNELFVSRVTLFSTLPVFILHDILHSNLLVSLKNTDSHFDFWERALLWMWKFSTNQWLTYDTHFILTYVLVKK